MKKRVNQRKSVKKNEKEKERKEIEEEKQEEKESERRKESEKRKETERKKDLKVNNEKGEKTKRDQEVNDEQEGETTRKESFYTKDSELKSVFYSKKPMFVLLYKETLLETNDHDSSLPSIISSLLQEFKYVIPEDDPGDFPPKETKELQSQVEEFISPCVIHVLLDPKKDGPWRICIYFHVINNIMVKIQGRIFSRKGGMMKIKAQKICDARAFTTYIGNSILIMENSYLGGCELKSVFYSKNPMFVLLYKETLLETNDHDSSLPSIISSLLQEFKYVIPEDDPGDLPPKETKELQSQVEEFISPCVIHVLLDPKKDGPWRICIYFHAINNIMVKIRGRIFSRKGGMMKIKAQKIRDARAFTTYIGNSILIMENSDLGGCETLETPNIFLFPSVLSFITILIWSWFILERFVLQVKVEVALFNLESLFF